MSKLKGKLRKKLTEIERRRKDEGPPPFLKIDQSVGERFIAKLKKKIAGNKGDAGNPNLSAQGGDEMGVWVIDEASQTTGDWEVYVKATCSEDRSGRGAGTKRALKRAMNEYKRRKKKK